MIVTRSDIESFKRFVPKLALAGAAVLILSAFAPSSDAAVFTAREGDAPLEFTLPAHETTMVAIPADPIASAVYDRHLIDVQTDAASGMLYVLPKMEGSAMVYVTCRSGETAPLHLTFTADAEPRTIILEKSVRRAEQANAPVRVPAAPLRAEGFPAEMKRLVTLVLRGEETDEVSRTAMTEPAQGAAAAMKRLACPSKASGAPAMPRRLNSPSKTERSFPLRSIPSFSRARSGLLPQPKPLLSRATAAGSSSWRTPVNEIRTNDCACTVRNADAGHLPGVSSCS